MLGVLFFPPQISHTWRAFVEALGTGVMPGSHLVDAVLLVGAVMLLIFPGPVTQIPGALLLCRQCGELLAASSCGD